MSIPNFPKDLTKIDWEQALSMVVASIAMEELALSHILNAEGEKLQYVLGTLHKEQTHCTSVDDILRVNESISCILDKVETNQILLKGKLEQAIKANQQHPKKAVLYHSKPDFCWYQGKPIPWGEGNPSCDPMFRIPLPPNANVLISYGFTFAQTAGERKVVMQIQKLQGAKRETLGVAEGQACYGERELSLCGCLSVPTGGQEAGTSEVEFLLNAPCSILVKWGKLTLTTL